MTSPARRAAVAATLVLLAGVAWAAVVLPRDSGHPAISGVAPPAVFVEDVRAGGRACQAIPAVAEPARDAMLTLGTYERSVEQVELVALSGKRQVSSSGPVTVGNRVATLVLRPALQPSHGALELCLLNRGAGRVAVAGVAHPPPPGSTRPGRTLSIAVVSRDRGSPLARASLTLDRYSSSRAGVFQGWVLILALLLFAAGAMAAVVLLVRGPGAGSGRAEPSPAGSAGS